MLFIELLQTPLAAESGRIFLLLHPSRGGKGSCGDTGNSWCWMGSTCVLAAVGQLRSLGESHTAPRWAVQQSTRIEGQLYGRQHSPSSLCTGDTPLRSCLFICKLSSCTGRDLANMGLHNAVCIESHIRARANEHCELLRQTFENSYNRHQKYLQMRSFCIAACWVTGRADNLSLNSTHML